MAKIDHEEPTRWIRITKYVCSDIPLSSLEAVRGSVHKAHFNPQGAVSIKIDGKSLGVKPSEFEYCDAPEEKQ